MQNIRVLDPTAAPPDASRDPGPDAGPLAGKRIGIRFDRTWQSFFHVKDEWRHALAAAGALVHEWEAGSRVGEEGERTRNELEGFADDLDIAIVGLGN